MKRFLTAVGLCSFLMLFGIFAFMPASQAEDNVLLNLINLPAPAPPNPLVQKNKKNRPDNFYSKSNPPGDDASREDLLDYWKAQNQFDSKYTYTARISEEAAKKLFAEIEDDPERLPEFINVLPKNSESAEFVKRLYDQELANRKYERDWRDTVKKWLTYNSPYFSDELLRTAQQVADSENYVTNQADLLALARVDWEKARPILERLLNDRNQPVSQTLARWAFYQRALREGNSSDIEKYRRELQSTVENRSEKAGNRDLAMDALVESGDFEGRDDWYYSLLSDETLFELRVGGSVYTGLTTIINHSPPEKYVSKMLELVKSDNKAVRNAAVRNLSTLVDEKNPEIIKALLPWLENPQWATEVNGERRTLIAALNDLVMPESVPGLLAVLNEKEKRDSQIPPYLGSNSNTIYSGNTAVTTATTTMTMVVEHYPHRYAALTALATQKDSRAVPALRLLLTQIEGYERHLVIRALLASNGFTVAEQIEALEAVAKIMNQQRVQAAQTTVNAIANINPEQIPEDSSEETFVMLANTNTVTSVPDMPYNLRDAKMILGTLLVGEHEPTDELVAAVIERIDYLEKREPNVSAALRKIVQNWNGAAVNSMLLRDLKNNKADADTVVKLLSQRRHLKEKQFSEVYNIRSGGALAHGVSACLTEDANDYDAILAGENVESKIAMLGCARLIRAKLPVREVGKYLQSPNKLLSLAAERYLESEDSTEARTMVLARYPNEAKVLGARSSFETGAGSVVNNKLLQELFSSVEDSYPEQPFYFLNSDTSELAAAEKKLQKEVKENQELLGVYSYDSNFIRIFKDKAVFSWEENASRYRERVLSKEEFDAFKSYLAAQRIDEMPPFLVACEDCEAKELTMLGRNGGRRVFVRADEMPKLFAELEKMLEDMRKPPAKLHYWLEKNISGLEILFEDKNLQARSVWKNGVDFRLLIDNVPQRKQIDDELEKLAEETEQKVESEIEGEEHDYEKVERQMQERRRRRQYENLAWYKFDPETKLSGLTGQPTGVGYIPAQDNPAIPATEHQWKARAANFEIRADGEGLHKITRGRAVKLREGYYYKPLVTPNGRWTIVTKYGDEEPSVLVRINLLTGKELKIKMEQQQPTYEAIAFVPSLNKVLVFSGLVGGGEEEYTEAETKETRYGKYFLLDPETGIVQPVKGEIRPLAQQTYRPLQPTAKPDEFWAAIPDEQKNETQFGVYNAKTLSFKSALKLPQIVFDSMDVWADEQEAKIYFVYEGQLLSVPMPKGN